MITKNYKSIFSYIAAFAIGAFMVSCDQEENTGLATLKPTSPTLTVTTDVSSKSLIEDNSVYAFTATLSEVQLVDTKLYIDQVGGDATMGDDFEVTSYIVIPAGSLTGKGSIKILADDLIEATETVKIQIGDEQTANAKLTPATMDFTILNYTDGDLAIDLSWEIASIATDNAGNEFDADEFADMRLLISTSPNNVDVVDEADGGSFESIVLSSSLASGTYYVVADFYDANSDIPRDLNLNVEFNQSGVINHSTEYFSGAINTANVCANNFFVLTKIVKSLNSYTITREGINNFENLTVTWDGTDADFPSEVATGVDCTGNVITGLNAGWMLDFWGEIVIDAGTIYYTVSPSGVVTIAKQFLYTTTYNGAVQPDYYISGTGTYNAANGTLNIQYYLDQDGFSPSNWAYSNGYQSTPYFAATLTVAP